ncbi:MAG TPA: hypothetical protein VLZ78_10195 [Terrimesophilobacter sp.]|nr:hypothetical protein [Terrimesophilobacter sp.]
MKKRLRLGAGAYLPVHAQVRYCFDIGPGGRPCFRQHGHGGRHATISTFGHVEAVWGEDVLAARRVTSRVTAAFREIPRILRIETARTWDGVAR